LHNKGPAKKPAQAKKCPTAVQHFFGLRGLFFSPVATIKVNLVHL